MNIDSFVAMPWVVPIVCGSVVGIVAIFSRAISDCVKTVSESNLKQSMVEHGYTAEQIDQVLKGRSGESRESSGKVPRAKQVPNGKGCDGLWLSTRYPSRYR